jgi:hypothetical protein
MMQPVAPIKRINQTGPLNHSKAVIMGRSNILLFNGSGFFGKNPKLFFALLAGSFYYYYPCSHFLSLEFLPLHKKLIPVKRPLPTL